MRAAQRTFEGAYVRTALGQFGFSLVVLKVFTREFYPIGALFSALGCGLLAAAALRRREGNRQFFRDGARRKFRTSGNVRVPPLPRLLARIDGACADPSRSSRSSRASPSPPTPSSSCSSCGSSEPVVAWTFVCLSVCLFAAPLSVCRVLYFVMDFWIMYCGWTRAVEAPTVHVTMSSPSCRR